MESESLKAQAKLNEIRNDINIILSVMTGKKGNNNQYFTFSSSFLETEINIMKRE